MQSIYPFKVKKIDGSEETLDAYRGQVLLIVNTASQCGFTPQYQGLEDLQKRYQTKGFQVLGFPCNQFGGQEPGTDSEIAQFCETRFGVTFPLFSKVDVNGPNTDPLFEHLKSSAPGLLGLEAIKWNFTKFLVDRQGQVVKRYAPMTAPKEIADDIEALLQTEPR